MKTLRFFALFLFLVAFVSASYSQGNKTSFSVPMTWNETIAPIPCIGPYSGEIIMEMTFFEENFDFTSSAKVLNKASGTITDLDGNEYTIKSVFNCNNFVSKISSSGNSNQAWTFRVRSAVSGKLVATVHMTFHYTDGAVDPDFSSVNAQIVCH